MALNDVIMYSTVSIDVTTLAEISGEPVHLTSRTQSTTLNPNYFATTRAENFHFFTLTGSNSYYANSSVGSFPGVFDACLAQASYQRCITASDCSSTTKNHVAQNVYSWDAFNMQWNDTGVGASGSQDSADLLTSYRPVVANGVKSLTHFSPDGITDFLIPSSFDEDLGRSPTPTRQCADVWVYVDNSHGWAKYQDCAWTGQGSRSIKAFQINGEQYIVQTNMVDRIYSTSNLSVILVENYTQPAFVFKWSRRTQDNYGQFHPRGFFLSGGEHTGGTHAPSNPAYVKDIGNNGANVFQVWLVV